MAEPSGLSLLSRLPDEVISAIFRRLEPEAIVKMANLDPEKLSGLAIEVLTSFSQEIAYASANNLRVYNELREKITTNGNPLSCLEILQQQIEDLHAQAKKLKLVVSTPREAESQYFRKLLAKIIAEEELKEQYRSFKFFAEKILELVNETASPEIVLPEEGLTCDDYRRRCWDILRPYLGNVSSIYLSAGLTRLPPEIVVLTKLKSLVLSDCQLTTLPTEISALTALQELDLSHNQLTALPTAISAFTQLQALYCADNYLTALPATVGALTALHIVYLNHNHLTALPDVISAFTQLQTLDLSHNQLTALPFAISALTALEKLDLHRNELTTLPDTMSALTGLQELDIRENQIDTQPHVIGSLSSLTTLWW